MDFRMGISQADVDALFGAGSTSTGDDAQGTWVRSHEDSLMRCAVTLVFLLGALTAPSAAEDGKRNPTKIYG